MFMIMVLFRMKAIINVIEHLIIFLMLNFVNLYYYDPNF